jgi:hypothetical protein
MLPTFAMSPFPPLTSRPPFFDLTSPLFVRSRTVTPHPAPQVDASLASDESGPTCSQEPPTPLYHLNIDSDATYAASSKVLRQGPSFGRQVGTSMHMLMICTHVSVSHLASANCHTHTLYTCNTFCHWTTLLSYGGGSVGAQPPTDPPPHINGVHLEDLSLDYS